MTVSEESTTQNGSLLEVRDLRTHFKTGTKGIIFGIGAIKQTVRAVDGVNLSIQKGETLGLVGESGCGKSTLGYTILQLETATSGEVYYDGHKLTGLWAGRRCVRSVRGCRSSSRTPRRP